MFVPCGKCAGCKVQRSIDSTSRLNNELSNYNYSIFITLTYDNKYIPFVPVGSRFICRIGDVDQGRITSIQLLQKIDTPLLLSKYHRINNFPDSVVVGTDPVGVIYYRDFQLYLKRFRKKLYLHYGKNITFRFAVTLEYGTITKRPHIHAIFGFNTIDLAKVGKRLLCECWSYGDSDRLSKYTVFCSKGIGSYLSSYVAGYIGSDELSTVKRFRPRFRRSNEITYGIEKKADKAITSVIKRFFGKEVFEFDRKDFYYQCGEKLNAFSARLVPSNVFSTYFHKLKGYGAISFVSFCICAYRIFRISEYQSRFGRFPAFEEELKSDDLSFFRSYKRVCILLDIEVFDFLNFCNYVKLFYKISAFYSALVLREQMLLYEQLSKEDYLTYCYNTFADENMSRARIRNIYRSIGLHSILSSNFYTLAESNKINNLIIKNKQKLIGKHINDLNFKL